MSYEEALHVVTNDFIIKRLVPGWVLGLTARLRKVKVGFEELQVRSKKGDIPHLFFPEIIVCVDVYLGNDTRA